jgi:hypothetical protein
MGIPASVISSLFAFFIAGAAIAASSEVPTNQHGSLVYTGKDVTCLKMDEAFRKLKVKPLPCRPFWPYTKWQPRGWYVDDNEFPANRLYHLAGPFLSRDSCETARLNRGAPDSFCRFHKRFSWSEMPSIPIDAEHQQQNSSKNENR